MKMLVALRDSKTGAFLPPLVVSSPGEAQRTYEDVLARGPSLITNHPGDFPLYEVGKFDDQTGEVFPLFHDNGAVAPARLMIDAGQLGGE